MSHFTKRATRPAKKLSHRSRRRATYCQLLCASDSVATTAIAGLHVCDACLERVRSIAADAGVVDGVP